jgi:hypothetical protein
MRPIVVTWTLAKVSPPSVSSKTQYAEIDVHVRTSYLNSPADVFYLTP